MIRAMWFRCMTSAILIAAVQALVCAADTDSRSDRVLDRQTDVVKAVGIVRYFHPHEAVTVVDWNRVLLDGFELAEGSGSDRDFAESLVDLLGQTGSGIERVEADPGESSQAALECEADGRPVRWVHQGLGAPPASNQPGLYESRRSNAQERPELDPQAFSNAMALISARPWRGKRLYFSSEARVPDGGEAALWIRVTDRKREILVFDNMDDRRISHEDWEQEGLVFVVPDEAAQIAVGMIAHGAARAEFRNIDLREFDSETDQPLGNSLLPDPEQWRGFSPPGVDEPELESTEAGLLVTLAPGTGLPAVDAGTMALFENAPTQWSLELLDGSRLRIPLALCPENTSMDGQVRALVASRFAVVDPGALSVIERARLDVATLWPVIQHFYPYRENLDDWPNALRSALEGSRTVEDMDAHRKLLQRLMVSAEDGHVRVHRTRPESGETARWLPVAVLPVDDELVVARADSAGAVRAGDRIDAIDGQPAQDWLAGELANFSGSSQWRRFRAVQSLLRGGSGDSRSLQIDRNGESLEVTLPFEAEEPLDAFDHPSVRQLGEGVVYVNLTTIDGEALSGWMPELADAQGVIFDLRGYPRGVGPEFLGHLLTSNDDFLDWMKVMLARSPDGNLVAGWKWEWSLEPAEPKIDAPVVVLTDHRAISYSESLIGMIQYHDLGTVVGSNTAGANGNVLPLQLPGGFTVTYTGMQVTGPDGQSFHGRGIQPDIRVEPTVEGLREGRDEVLERGIRVFGDPAL